MPMQLCGLLFKIKGGATPTDQTSRRVGPTGWAVEPAPALHGRAMVEVGSDRRDGKSGRLV